MTHRSDTQNRRIGRYRIVRRIGAGGMGEVFEGWDDQLQRPVAVKGLQADVKDESLRHRLRREALTTAAINHPAIAHVYETVCHEGHDWLVMEYIDGQTIAETLRGGPLRSDEVARIGEEVARALQAAHEKGLIHRDVKAENVMITSDGHVKVLDFGLARRPAAELPTDPRLTVEGTVLGTTRAMSPEQALGRELDARSDIFSLGSLLYEMVTGAPAFRGETPAETLVKVAKGEFVPIDQTGSRIPDELIALITRCLSVEPDDRPGSAGEVAAALRRVRATATHGTAVLPSVVVAAPARLWRTRNLLLAAALVSVAGAVLIGRGVATRDRVTVAPLPVQGVAIDPRTQVAVDEALRSALLVRSRISVVPDEALRPCLGGGGPSAEVARQVGADELLECSLVRGGDTLRITLTRIAAASGRILWSGQAEADPASLLHLQAQVASLVDGGFADRPPTDRPAPRELSADALVAYADARREGAGPAARRGFERAAELAPRWIEPLLALFADDRDVWLATRDPARLDACREQVSRLQALAPDDPRTSAARVQLEVMEGRLADALATARAARGRRPDDAGAAVRLAVVLALSDDGERSGAAFDTADALARSWSVPFARAQARLARGDADGTGQALNQALQRSPGNLAVLTALVDLALRTDDLESAEGWARRRLAAREDEPALRQLGLVMLLQRRWAAATDTLRRATELQASSTTAAIELASTLWASGESPASRTALVAALLNSDRALTDNASDPAALAARARALALLGRRTEAVRVANELQIERRGDPDAALTAALAAAVVGDRNTALAALRLALANGAPRALLRRPELDGLRSTGGLSALEQAPPRPEPLRFVLPALGPS